MCRDCPIVARLDPDFRAIGDWIMHSKRVETGVFSLLLMFGSVADAHHSRANFGDTVAEISGTLVDYSWRNPHVFLEIEARNATGETQVWLIEAHSVTGMKRLGWGRDTLTPGMPITISGRPDRDSNKLFALLDFVLMDDGSRMYAFRDPNAPPPEIEPSTDFSGTWYADRDRASFLLAGGRPPEDWPYTAKGLAQAAAFNPEDSPELECQPVGVPKMTLYAYGINWTRSDTTIHIEKEHLDENRIIYLSPQEAGFVDSGPSYVGHSIGRFESDRHLVVETTGFRPTRWGLANGIDSGSGKKIVEQFRLAENGLAMDITYTLEDPEYLLTPVTVTGRYRKVDDRVFSASNCDPETAKRHLTRD